MPKVKKVSYALIKPDSIPGVPMYEMLRELVDQFHDDEISHARIALAWNLSWKADVDGRVVLGKCKKASDLDRELAAYDFVIILNQEFWENADVKDWQRRALLDHELCHAAVTLDEAGEPVEDQRGRLVYRTRKHDIEEFTNIVLRHGCYKRDLEAFAAALRAGKQRNLLDQVDAVLGMEDAGCSCAGSAVRKVDCPVHGVIAAGVEALRPKEGSITFSREGREPVTLHAKGVAES